jgi:hypothetical protein
LRNGKICTGCQRELDTSSFHKDKQKKDGLCTQCKECKKLTVSKYYALNKKLCNERKSEYHQRNKGIINAKRRKHDIQGRGQFNKMNPSHFDFGSSLRKPFGESSFARLIRQYKANALRRNLEFDLTVDEIRILTSGNCHYCGASPTQIISSKDANGHYAYNGIDRVNSKEGYTKLNCVSCCKICNKAKSNITETDWQGWINRLIVFHTAGNFGFKKTLEKDETPKSLHR